MALWEVVFSAAAAVPLPLTLKALHLPPDPQHLEQCLAQSRRSINICQMNGREEGRAGGCISGFLLIISQALLQAEADAPPALWLLEPGSCTAALPCPRPMASPPTWIAATAQPWVDLFPVRTKPSFKDFLSLPCAFQDFKTASCA